MAVRMSTSAAAVWTATGTWADAPTHVGVWLGNNFLGADDFAAPDTLQSGDSYTIASGMRYDWTITPDGAAAGSADSALAALMQAGADEVAMSLSLHDGDPGNAGTANEIAVAQNAGYARKSVGFAVTAV